MHTHMKGSNLEAAYLEKINHRNATWPLYTQYTSYYIYNTKMHTPQLFPCILRNKALKS